MNSLFDDYNNHPGFHDPGQSGWDFGELIGTLGQAFFQDQHSSGSVVGTPGEDSHTWVEQTTPYTCAVVSQEMILHSFGINASEAQLTYEATAHGWLTDGGTSMENMSQLLDLHGVATHTVPHGSVDALVAELAQGHKVIAAIDSGEMWKTDSPWEELFKSHGAEHAIVVTGLDMRDSGHPKVYINDPGDPAGAGKAYPLDEFLNAWGQGGDLYVATNSAPSSLAHDSLFGSNFNPTSGMYMDTNFWQEFVKNLAQTISREAFSHFGISWRQNDQAAATVNPWEGMSTTERNDLFMQI